MSEISNCIHAEKGGQRRLPGICGHVVDQVHEDAFVVEHRRIQFGIRVRDLTPLLKEPISPERGEEYKFLYIWLMFTRPSP